MRRQAIRNRMKAFLLASQPRLGANSPANVLPRELFSIIYKLLRYSDNTRYSDNNRQETSGSYLSRFMSWIGWR